MIMHEVIEMTGVEIIAMVVITIVSVHLTAGITIADRITVVVHARDAMIIAALMYKDRLASMKGLAENRIMLTAR
jgi:hypothetical protein